MFSKVFMSVIILATSLPANAERVKKALVNLPPNSEIPADILSTASINEIAEAIVGRIHEREMSLGPRPALIPDNELDVNGLSDRDSFKKGLAVTIKHGSYNPDGVKSVKLDLIENGRVVINFLPDIVGSLSAGFQNIHNPAVTTMGTNDTKMRILSEDTIIGLRLPRNGNIASRLRPKSGWLYVPNKILIGDAGREIVSGRYGHAGAILTKAAMRRTLVVLGDSLTFGKTEIEDKRKFEEVATLMRGSLPFLMGGGVRYHETLTLGDISVSDIDHFVIYDLDQMAEALPELKKLGRPIYEVDLKFSNALSRPEMVYKKLLHHDGSASCAELLSDVRVRTE